MTGSTTDSYSKCYTLQSESLLKWDVSDNLLSQLGEWTWSVIITCPLHLEFRLSWKLINNFTFHCSQLACTCLYRWVSWVCVYTPFNFMECHHLMNLRFHNADTTVILYFYPLAGIYSYLSVGSYFIYTMVCIFHRLKCQNDNAQSYLHRNPLSAFQSKVMHVKYLQVYFAPQCNQFDVCHKCPLHGTATFCETQETQHQSIFFHL